MVSPRPFSTSTLQLVPLFFPGVPGISTSRWLTDEAAPPPSVIYNPGDTPLTWGDACAQYPPRATALLPGHRTLVVVGWQSPVDATIAVSGGVADLCIGDEDAIRWSIVGPRGQVASGELVEGGSQRFADGAGGEALDSIAVVRGDFLYLVVNSGAGAASDVTLVEWEIEGPHVFVRVAGPPSGRPLQNHTFTATVTGTVSYPVTYTWRASGLPSFTRTVASAQDTFAFAWPTDGAQVVTVTASMVTGKATATRPFLVGRLPEQVTVEGPSTVFLNERTGYTATVRPADVAFPLTYTWSATGQPPYSARDDQPVHAVSIQWEAVGPQVITVTAANTIGVAVATKSVTVVGPTYLPIVRGLPEPSRP
jgi:hypothetical protein